MIEQTARDYAQETINQQTRENQARQNAADWLQTMLLSEAADLTVEGDVRLKEWRLVSGNQSELKVQRPDGMVVTFTITAQEA